MTELGEALRECREQSRDPLTQRPRLSLERMAELVGLELGNERLTFQTVSNWELGRTRISDRDRLMAVMAVLRRCGGLRSSERANQILWAGNFRYLDAGEGARLFPGVPAGEPETACPAAPGGQWHLVFFMLGELVFEPNPALRRRLSAARAALPADWAGLLVAGLRWATGRLSIYRFLRGVLWVWVWLFTWLVLTPSWLWPFADRGRAWAALVLYVGATFIAPLMVGVLTGTRDSTRWPPGPRAQARLLRAFTYLGAAGGFHLGYMAAVAVALAGHYLGRPFAVWPSLAGAALPLITSSAAARLAPRNLWRAHGRLRLADGAGYLWFGVFGVLWAVFFYMGYPLLLQPLPGLALSLGAVTLIALLMAWQHRRTGSTLIPAHVWVLLYGLFLASSQLTAAASALAVAALAGLVMTQVIALGRAQPRVTPAPAAGALLVLIGAATLLALLVGRLGGGWI